MMYYSQSLTRLMTAQDVSSIYGEQVLSYSLERQIELGLYPAITTTAVFNKYRQTTTGYVMTYYDSSTPGYDQFLGYNEYYLQEWTIVPLTGTALEYSTAAATTQATVVDVTTLINTDSTVYGASTAPVAAPSGQSGWYFINDNPSDAVGWLIYENAAVNVSQTFGALTTVWAIINIIDTNSHPYLMLYSQPTGTGDEDPSYHSVWQYEDYLTPPATPGTYLMYWGEDPGVRRDLPRINITQVPGAGSAGDQADAEVLKNFFWITDSPGTPNDEEFVMQSWGYIIAGKVSVATLVAI